MYVVAFVVAAPLIFVWVSDVVDRTVGRRMKVNVTECAENTAELLSDTSEIFDESEVTNDLDAIAWRYGTRIRVTQSSGTVIHDRDHAGGSSLVRWIAEWVLRPDEPPTLREYDSSLPPVDERWEVQEATLLRPAQTCGYSKDGKLLVCSAALRVDHQDGDYQVIYVQQASRRATRTLYDVRYHLLRMSIFTLLMGLLVALWIGTRLVRPIEDLQSQILARASAPHGAVPVKLERDDELGDLAKAFNELLGALDQRSRANEAFVVDLAHEMKNPVAAIRACSEAMEGKVDEQRAKRLSRVLADSSRRLDELVTRFLELARAEAGLHDQQREQVQVHALVNGIVETLAGDERYQSIAFRIEGETAIVEGVSSQLETALRNVIDNAASFADDGGSVEVAITTRNDSIEVRVTDSGPGIEEKDLPRVFDRFYTTRAGQRRGTGLGLALCRAVIEAHGGTISAESPKKGGATFVIRLPVAS
jgi:signal transduction histidine kinase